MPLSKLSVAEAVSSFVVALDLDSPPTVSLFHSGTRTGCRSRASSPLEAPRALPREWLTVPFVAVRAVDAAGSKRDFGHTSSQDITVALSYAATRIIPNNIF